LDPCMDTPSEERHPPHSESTSDAGPRFTDRSDSFWATRFRPRRSQPQLTQAGRRLPAWSQTSTAFIGAVIVGVRVVTTAATRRPGRLPRRHPRATDRVGTVPHVRTRALERTSKPSSWTTSANPFGELPKVPRCPRAPRPDTHLRPISPSRTRSRQPTSAAP
jgi:hypothetical protein